MFDAARLRLTRWYTLILAVVLAVLSFALYHVVLAAQQSELRSGQGHPGSTIARGFAHDEVVLAYQITAIDLAMMVLAAAGAYFLAGRTLQPIREVTERQRRFAAAASHELRTPLTGLQGTLEVALLNRRSTEEYEDVIRDSVAETERMGRLVKDLAMLGQADVEGKIRLAGKRDRGQAVLMIRDTGAGIPRAELAHLFEPFYQVDGARSAAGHVGLGLALAAWIVRAHNGRIDAESREGVGSVFTLSLPLAG